MGNTKSKKGHKALLSQYIKEIENPDKHGFIGGRWMQSPYKGDDPNNRGYGIDILQNKDAAKLVKGRPGKWISEDEERRLRNNHLQYLDSVVNNNYYKYLRRTPLTQEKEIMATGLLYRGDHINGTKLAEPYYNGSNEAFQKAVEDYYKSKNLNDRAWRSKEFMDAHKAANVSTAVSLESPYVPMEYIGYHPNENYYYAGELPQTDVFGEHKYANGGMLYGNQGEMSNAPQEEYQQGETSDTYEQPRQWDDLSLAEKNAFIANAVKHGLTNMDDIRRAYNELAQSNGEGDYTPQDNLDEKSSPYNDDGSSVEQAPANVFLKGGYKPSKYIKSFISHMEGDSMKTNRSFEAEAKDFWDAVPQEIKKKITQQQADALYSYSYNVGAGNFKKRVIPALQAYFNGTGNIDKVQRSMWASKDNQLRGLANRRAQERAMFAGSEVPVYYNNEGNDYAPQNINTWRNSRLGPVNSINISKGLGVVDNNAMRGNAMLGPVNRLSNGMTEEAINTLYDDGTLSAIPSIPQEQESSLDRYNEIQDYLSSMSPFSYAKGGRMYDDGGVVSSNGQYHVNPSDYNEVLSNVSSGKPLEVTLPDTTVTAADPRNYRSYYDPNGFMDFANIVTLGLPNRGSLSQDLGLARDAYDALRGRKTWGDVGNSAIMGNKGVFDNPYANLALDFAVPVAEYKFVKPLTNYANNTERRVAETFMRTTPSYNPIYESKDGFINMWKGLNGGKTRLAHITNYWLTGKKTGPKGYYNSFAGYIPYNASQLVNNPTLKEKIRGFFHPEGTSYAYSGFSSFAGKVPAMREGNDLIDAYLYGKEIDPIYGVKRVAKGKDFDVHSDFIKKNYSDKANDIPVYEMNVPSRYSDSDIISSNVWHPAEGGLFDTGSFNTSVNAAGHLYKEGITPYGKPVVMQQDIWKFKPDDYYTKWFNQDKPLTSFMRNVIKFGLKEVDRLGTPVITLNSATL